MTLLRFLAMFALLCGLAACSHITKDAHEGINGGYAVTEIEGHPFVETPAFINIVGDQILGEGPVNKWVGTIQNGTVSELVTTRRAGPEIFMRIETALLTNLSGSRLQVGRSGTLKFAKNDKVLVRLAPLDR